MRALSNTIPAICFALIAFTSNYSFADVFWNDSPYLSSADSPFSGSSFDYYHLEDLEDSSIDTPGLTATGGFISFINRDSVDADDGVIDGNGSNGFSYAQQSSFTSVSFQFDDSVLGAFPTHAGIVWTDGGADGSGAPGSFTFEAFDVAGFSLGSITTTLGDGIINGPTDEDRFFGATNASGISKITFTNNSADSLAFIEVDHIQYGQAVPEPSGCIPLAISAISFLGFRRRRAGE